MVEIIAKKYSKAIVENIGFAELESFLKNFKKLAEPFYVKKFLDIVNSPCVSKDDKQDFLLQFADKKYANFEKIKNFIRLLAENNRLDAIPSICELLQANIDEQNNSYVGVLYLSKEGDSTSIDKIKKNLSERLNIDLDIQQRIVDIEGIKLVIEDLDIEVSFSKEYFLSELKSHILKAI